jgi:hypothetical protein
MNLPDIVCQKCGVINDVTVTPKSNQWVATCNACGSFIKNVPHPDSEIAIWFGKYRGKLIKDYNIPEEIDYLKWVRNTPDIWNQKLNQRTRDAITLKLK